MEYITITSDTYENAVAQAKEKYGTRVRIHSRRDYTVGGGLFMRKRPRCEIVCYLSNAREEDDKASAKDIREFEKEAKTPDPTTLTAEERSQTVLSSDDRALKEATELLELNEITSPLKEKILDEFAIEGNEDLAISVADKIFSLVKIDHENQARPARYMVFLGPTGSGKTTTLAKIAKLYQDVGRKVAIITLDSYRVGAYEQTKAFGDAFDIPVELVQGEDEVLTAQDRLSDYDLVLVDTMGVSPKDGALNLKLKGMLSLFNPSDSLFVLICAANLKASDLMMQYRHYHDFKIGSLIVTKLDETESIGSFLSFSYKCGKPMLFCTNGQKVPSDLKKVSTTVILEYLRGFGINVSQLAAQLS